jgi:transposase
LLSELKFKKVIADKGYDSNRLISSIHEGDAEAVIPPRKTRLVQRSFDKEAYRSRNTIERLIGRLKQFRRIATRYDKTATSCASFINFAVLFIF